MRRGFPRRIVRSRTLWGWAAAAGLLVVLVMAPSVRGYAGSGQSGQDAGGQAPRAAWKELMPLVKPGLRLPNENGVFALDAYKGLPELVHVRQADGDLNQNPYDSVQAVDAGRMHAFRELVRMRGVAARVQLHVEKPVFYVSLGGAPPSEPSEAFEVNTHGDSGGKQEAGGGSAHSRYVIVRVTRQGSARVVFAKQLRGSWKGHASGDRVTTRKKILPGGYWMKVTPVHALDPGEYVLVEVLSPKEVNRDVWAFGVNPGAPENGRVITPVGPGTQR